ncbi:MAG: RDD family protein [Cellvibrio sp.]
MILDTRLSLETPEGAALPLAPAGLGVRIMAFLIDMLIKSVAIIIVFTLLGIFGGMGMGIALILTFLLEWFYPVYFEVWHQGRTPGKKNLNIRVINDDGTPVTFGASLLRNLLRVVDFLPLVYLTGIITSLFNARFKRLGDLVAGTLVVYDADPTPDPDFDIKGRQPVPTDFTTDEQRALLAFAERSKRLSPERQSELAGILLPVLKTDEPVITIKQMANSMVGRQ